MVRTLCSQCVTWAPADEFERQLFSGLTTDSELKLPHPVGCDQCNQSGFTGRTAIYEVVPVDEQMRRLIHGNAPEFELEQYARNQAQSIRQDGLQKVLAGKTTVEEVLRVTQEE